MTLQRMIQMVALSVKKLRDPYYHGFAAQMAFYFLMSIVPTIILFSRLLNLRVFSRFYVSTETISKFLEEYVARDVADLIIRMLEFQSVGSMNLVFIVIMLVAASKAEFALMRIANYTLTDGRSTGNGYWKERVRAMTTVPQTLISLVFGLIVMVYGELIIKLVLTTLLNVFNISYEVNDFWLFLRWPVTILMFFFMVSYSYYILPSDKLKFREIVPGSVFASVGMLAVTVGYKVYAEHVSRYDILYGSLASVVAVMMWFYFLAWALVLGIMFNKVWAETAHMKTALR
ncbi:MAG: YihY/virulence factor BrkB family protein [Anaerovoracaceae bacterium]